MYVWYRIDVAYMCKSLRAVLSFNKHSGVNRICLRIRYTERNAANASSARLSPGTMSNSAKTMSTISVRNTFAVQFDLLNTPRLLLPKQLQCSIAWRCVHHNGGTFDLPSRLDKMQCENRSISSTWPPWLRFVTLSSSRSEPLVTQLTPLSAQHGCPNTTQVTAI